MDLLKASPLVLLSLDYDNAGISEKFIQVVRDDRHVAVVNLDYVVSFAFERLPVHQFSQLPPALEERRALGFDVNTFSCPRVSALVNAVFPHLEGAKPRISMRPPFMSCCFIMKIVVRPFDSSQVRQALRHARASAIQIFPYKGRRKGSV